MKCFWGLTVVLLTYIVSGFRTVSRFIFICSIEAVREGYYIMVSRKISIIKRSVAYLLILVLIAGMFVNVPDQSVNSIKTVEAADAAVYVKATAMYGYAYQVLSLINQQRTQYGLNAVQMDMTLLNGAMQRAAESVVIGAAYDHSEIDNSIAHSRPDGTSCFTVNDKIEGENIAYGQTSPSSVVTAWMNSEGHRKNILTAEWKSVGIGVVYIYGDYYYYWAQSFSSQSASIPTVRNDSPVTSFHVNVSNSVYNRLVSRGKMNNGVFSSTTPTNNNSSGGSSGGGISGNWTQDSRGWKFYSNGKYLRNSWLRIGTKWYALGSDGYMITGWRMIEGSYYYFHSSGVMASNEWVGGYWLGSSGAWTYHSIGSWHNGAGGWWYGDTSGWYASNCWQKINGNWYYFNSSGYMLTNTSVDGYWLGADGAML